jgi:hypothetical protein
MASGGRLGRLCGGLEVTILCPAHEWRHRNVRKARAIRPSASGRTPVATTKRLPLDQRSVLFRPCLQSAVHVRDVGIAELLERPGRER